MRAPDALVFDVALEVETTDVGGALNRWDAAVAALRSWVEVVVSDVVVDLARAVGPVPPKVHGTLRLALPNVYGGPRAFHRYDHAQATYCGAQDVEFALRGVGLGPWAPAVRAA